MTRALMTITVTGFCALLTLACVKDAGSRPISPEPPGAFSTLRVGLTGIMCYQEPCPWRGVVEVGPDNAPIRPSAIWSGDEPPPVAGAPEDVETVLDAYAQGCVLVDGRMLDGVLEIRRVLSEC